MTLIRRKPLGNISIFDELFKDMAMNNNGWNGGTRFPAINVKKMNAGFEIEVAAPGLIKSDFKIEVSDGTLTISSEKKIKNEGKTETGNYTRKEFSYSSFSRSFTLLSEADEDKINAAYEGGILKVFIPNSETKVQKIKHIDIK